MIPMIARQPKEKIHETSNVLGSRVSPLFSLMESLVPKACCSTKRSLGSTSGARHVKIPNHRPIRRPGLGRTIG
jgi:hypothetical protein